MSDDLLKKSFGVANEHHRTALRHNILTLCYQHLAAPDNFSTWTTFDVAVWLAHEPAFLPYVDLFVEHCVTGLVLPGLGRDRLVEMGVVEPNHQTAILKARDVVITKEIPRAPWHIELSALKFVTVGMGQFRAIGDGAYCSVVLASYKDRKVAVKMLKLPVATDVAEAPALMSREAATHARLDHANICKFYGANITCNIEEGLMPFMVLELVPSTLAQHLIDPIKSRALLQPARIRILKELASALAFLHIQVPRIWHCDLKPENVLLNERMTVKLTDFGLAEEINKSYRLSAHSHQSTKGASKGTPGYMAPEMYSGILSELVDVFSFGMIASYVLGGAAPYAHCIDALHIKEEVLKGERPSLESVPVSMRDMISACWHHERRERCKMHDVVAMLDRASQAF